MGHGLGTRWLRPVAAGVVLAALTSAIGSGPAAAVVRNPVPASGSAVTDGGFAAPRAQPRTARWTRLQVVYAYATGTGPRPGRVDAIRATIATMDVWYTVHLAGGSPRLVTGPDGSLSVVELPLDMPQWRIDRTEDLVYDRFREWQAAGVFPPDAVPIVYLEGEQDEDACAWQYETRRLNYVTVPMWNCRYYRPRPDGRFADSGGYLVAHEVGHALGAVSPRAPHGTRGWHVRGDVRDLMYGGYRDLDWERLTLDPGNDDYYLTGRDDLANIEQSPLLEWP